VTATTCSVARAEVGLSYLGMCQPTWMCRASLKAFDNVPVIRTGWLENTFGDDCPCVSQLLNDERPKEVRVHIANGPCMRNRRCGRYEIFYGHTIASSNRAIKRGDKRLLGKFERVLAKLAGRLAGSRGPLTCYVSPVLESDNDIETRRLLHRLTASYLPSCTLVDNPLRGSCLRGAVCERHGPTPGLTRPCVADLDGSTVDKNSVATFLRTTRHCDMSLVWSLGLNCNGHHTSGFIDPRKRNCVQNRADYRELAGWLHREFR
jgi:hypothetical protein